MNKNFLAAAMLAMAVFAPAAPAQNMIPGSVQYDDNSDTSSLRIARPTVMRANTSETASYRSFSTGVSAADFSSKLLQPQQRITVPYLHSTVIQNTQFSPQVGAPYIWNQSILGGYWDSSGATKDVVRADKLYLYGGKFADGTPVSKEPIRDFNSMGHAYRASSTPTQAFWSH